MAKNLGENGSLGSSADKASREFQIEEQGKPVVRYRKDGDQTSRRSEWFGENNPEGLAFTGLPRSRRSGFSLSRVLIPLRTVVILPRISLPAVVSDAIEQTLETITAIATMALLLYLFFGPTS
jgi:hypothetical protein